MRLYNTMSKVKEEFVPIERGKVSMYVCGPTVYNYIHIGNARPMIVFDTARRYFEFRGYEVRYVSNFTDVDDKIIREANEEGCSASEIAERYIAECKKDMAAMNVRPATVHPRATQEIGGMIEMIRSLIDQGYAYEKNGTVYFSTRKDPDYGKLSHKNLDDLRAAAAHCWSVVRTRRRIRLILFCGSQRKKENRTGTAPGDRDARAGILNAPSWPEDIWDRRSTFMPAVKIWYFRITKMKSHSPNAATMLRLRITGCTMHF